MIKSKKLVRILSLTLIFVLVASIFSGCKPKDNATSKNQSENSAKGVTKIKLPTYRSGENAGATFFIPQVERFNEKYKDKYEIEVEITQEASHTDLIKNLAQQDKLPPVFQVSDASWIETYLIPNGKLQDLTEFVKNHPDIEKLLIEQSVEHVTKEDKMIAMPLTVLRTTGLYYNKALFKPSKPITDMTWDEFSDELGDNVMAFQTAEGGWTISLTLASILGTIDGGKELLEAGTTKKITDFNKPQFVEAFKKLQELMKKHGWDGAVGVPYAAAANTFYSSKSAVLPDGTWIIDMINDPEESSGGFDSKNIVGDYFPGNVAIANPAVYDWMVSASATEDEKEVAYAFLEFMNSPEEMETYILAEGGASPHLDYSESFTSKLKENRILNEFNEKINEKTTYVPYLHEVIDASLYTGEYTNLLTELYLDKITPEAFCDKLTKAAKE